MDRRIVGERGNRTAAVGLVAALLVSGCAGGAVPTPSASGESPTASASTTTLSAEDWAADLESFDTQVRSLHPNPFANTSEADWTAKLEELKVSLPGATPDEQIARFASLVGMLDTHTAFLLDPYRQYDVLLYPFSDGWFVVRARDPGLVGSRFVSINGHPAAEVEAALRPLVAADNESGELDGLQGPMTSVEILHGLGIVDDPEKPGFAFVTPDGTETIEDLTSTKFLTWERDLDIIGGLVGRQNEAVKRRGEAVWTRLDGPTKTFILGYNDYTEGDLEPAIEDMKAALDDGSAERVLVDMRYIRGGNGSLAWPLLGAVKSDPRIDRPGGLIVMIGRENVSAGTIVARAFDMETQAVLIGEMTPARADNFLCTCQDITLPKSGLLVSVPTEQAGVDDDRLAVEPDVAVGLNAKDFFAGKDPALDAALALEGPVVR